MGERLGLASLAATSQPTGKLAHSVFELIEAIAEPSILIGHRFIACGDEYALRSEEAVHFQNAVPKVRRQSGAARIVARELLSRLDFKDAAITKTSFGAPVWPQGISGSLAHEEKVAVAAVAKSADYLALGVDIESVGEVPDNLVDIIATSAEQSFYTPSLLHGLQLFAAKEAVYKALFPLDRCFLDFHDIEVDLARQTARVSYGRTLAVKVLTGSHVIALAFLPANGPISEVSLKSNIR
jgi:4'-phosphopantetheinyl transferase EntD